MNGSAVPKSSIRIPPQIQRTMTILESLPNNHLITSGELAERLGVVGLTGAFSSVSVLLNYREKIGTKNFWGSPKTITNLRKQLLEPEASDGQS